MNHAPWRRWLRNLHLALGISVGVAMAATALTGTALALKGPLIRLELGTMLDASPPTDATTLPAAAWVEKAQRVSGGDWRLMSVSAPQAGPVPAATVLAFLSNADQTRHLMVSLDPASNRVLGSVVFETTVFFRVLDFHRALLSGAAGSAVMAIAGLGLVLSMISGLLLWWPGTITVPTSALGRLRFAHGLIGAIAAVPVLLIAVSGGVLAKPDWFVPSPAPPAAPIAPVSEPDAPACRPVADLAQAVALAQDQFPGPPFVTAMAGGPGSGHLVRLGGVMVGVDPTCGRVRQQSPTGLPARMKARGLASPIHAHLNLGSVGQMMVAGTGLALTFLSVSGIISLCRRRHRAKPPPTPPRRHPS